MKRLLIAALFVGGGTLALISGGIPYGEGSRVGVVQKFSKKGILFQTGEGELVMDGLRSRTTGEEASLTNIWAFSADPRAEVSRDIEAAVVAGGRVRLLYKEARFTGLSYGLTPYRIVRVERLP